MHVGGDRQAAAFVGRVDDAAERFGGVVLMGEAGKHALDRWISWAQRCCIPAFAELQRRIVMHRNAIDAALDHGLSQGLIESCNTEVRALTRVAYGFKSHEALIALAMLTLGGYRSAYLTNRSPDDPRERQESPKKHL